MFHLILSENWKTFLRKFFWSLAVNIWNTSLSWTQTLEVQIFLQKLRHLLEEVPYVYSSPNYYARFVYQTILIHGHFNIWLVIKNMARICPLSNNLPTSKLHASSVMLDIWYTRSPKQTIYFHAWRGMDTKCYVFPFTLLLPNCTIYIKVRRVTFLCGFP